MLFVTTYLTTLRYNSELRFSHFDKYKAPLSFKEENMFYEERVASNVENSVMSATFMLRY